MFPEILRISPVFSFSRPRSCGGNSHHLCGDLKPIGRFESSRKAVTKSRLGLSGCGRLSTSSSKHRVNFRSGLPLDVMGDGSEGGSVTRLGAPGPMSHGRGPPNTLLDECHSPTRVCRFHLIRTLSTLLLSQQPCERLLVCHPRCSQEYGRLRERKM